MAPPRPPRLLPALRALLYWSLVYGYCGLCASVHLLKLLWSIGRAPAQTFRRAARPSPPACLSDPSLGTHCYVRIKDSGLRFHYVAAGERGRPLMLLLHGFPEFWYSWRHQLREFKSEYRVVALDLRGYGESDAPAHLESYKLDCLIADTKDIVDSLGYSKCVLIGHDWGGMIAWLIAICYPEMIMKLIVINFPHPSVFTEQKCEERCGLTQLSLKRQECAYIPVSSFYPYPLSLAIHGQFFFKHRVTRALLRPSLYSEYFLRHPAQLFRSSFYYFFQIPRFPEFMFSINDFKALKHLFTSQSTGIGRRGRQLTSEDLDAYVYVFSQPGALSGPINHYRNIFSCLPLKQHMVTTPTLLLWGEEDAFMEAEMAEVTKTYVKNYFRLSVLSEGSHWLQQEQPDTVNRLIWAFLREETRRDCSYSIMESRKTS